MRNAQAIIKYIALNFGPLLAFYLVHSLLGLRAAICAGLAVTIFEVVRLKLRKKKMNTFFIFSAAIAILFGVIDLVVKEPVLLKFEAGIINLLFALFFTLSLFKEKPIAQELAEQQGRTDSEMSPDKTFFFRFITGFWSLYFFCKAGVYIWFNINNSLMDGFIFRIFVGNISFALMLFLTLRLSNQIWNLFERLRIFPSFRIKNEILPDKY